jgi:hypothetical protein
VQHYLDHKNIQHSAHDVLNIQHDDIREETMPINLRLICSSAVLAAALASGIALAQTASPSGAAVYVISPKDGDTVTSPFKVVGSTGRCNTGVKSLCWCFVF